MPQQPLIEPADLHSWLSHAPEEQQPHLLDVRWQLGREPDLNAADYRAEHLPGAVFVDLEATLSAPLQADGRGGRHPMPSRERVEAGLRDAGVLEGRPVVLYDQGLGLGAARGWWLLRYFGLSDVRVLHGGLSAWHDAGLPTQQGPINPSEGDVQLQAGARRLVTAEDLMTRGADGADGQAGPGVLVDARPADRHAGQNETIDPVAGHIPGSGNLPAFSTLTEQGRFRSREEIQALADQAGIDDSAPVTLYCGSGVQACHVALALESRGVIREPAGVYIGSWSDWISDFERPISSS